MWIRRGQNLFNFESSFRRKSSLEKNVEWKISRVCARLMNIQTRFSEKLPLKGTNFILLLFSAHSRAGQLLLLYFPSSSVTLSRLTLFDEFSYIFSKKSNIQRIIQTLIQFDVEPPPLIFPTHTILSFSPLYEEREREREKSSNSRKLGRNGPVISITIPRAPEILSSIIPQCALPIRDTKEALPFRRFLQPMRRYIYIFFFYLSEKKNDTRAALPLSRLPPTSFQNQYSPTDCYLYRQEDTVFRLKSSPGIILEGRLARRGGEGRV